MENKDYNIILINIDGFRKDKIDLCPSLKFLKDVGIDENSDNYDETKNSDECSLETVIGTKSNQRNSRKYQICQNQQLVK